MTHTVGGYIFSPQRFNRRDIDRANQVVAEWMRKNGDYQMNHDALMGVGRCMYSMIDGDGEGVQPLIDVLNKSVKLSSWIGFDFAGGGHLGVIVRGGSHVGIHNREDAQQIYDTTACIRRKLGKEMPRRRLEMIFDDRTRMYLPADFRNAIRRVA